MRVLVATEDLTFSVSLSHAYKAAGHTVSAGTSELYLGLREFDLIHFHWPEELTVWEMPPPARVIARVIDRIDALKPEARMVATVHNLIPHADSSGGSRTLYEQFYARMDRIGHFSQSSMKAFSKSFPDVPADKQFIHGMNDFADLRPLSTGRDAARASLGIAPRAAAVAAIGQLRSFAEFDLLRGGIEQAARSIPAIHIIRAFRTPGTSGWSARIRRKRAMDRLARNPISVMPDYLENDELVAVSEAADIIVIARMENQLNSGVLPLAMTFGTGLVAPDCGVFREMLGASMNELYTPGDPAALSQAIARLAAKDPAEVRAANLALSADWGWHRGVERVLAAFG